MNITIGIVEDQHKIRENLVKRFNFYDDMDVNMLASNGEEALQILESKPEEEYPDIILMDIGLPGMSGIDTTAHVKAAYPDIDIMIQTVFEDDDRIFQSIQAGASGYLLKDDSIEKYVHAIRDMKKGGAPISSSVASRLLKRVRNTETKAVDPEKALAEKFSITKREMDILNGIVKDLTEHQIADNLFISPHTVRTHIKNIYKKLHVHSRASAVKIALQNGFMS
ncbi:MAG: response regulator transcription factor [Balneolaceae bacterium]|nr:response regulator transcription factor [Balneolaceae bacterium]